MYPGSHDPEGAPLIKAGDLSGNRINPSPQFRIAASVQREYRRTELIGGELLMTLVGNVGSCAIATPEMRGWNVARAVAVIRLADPTDASFVRVCLLSREIRHLMDVWSNTTVQQTLNLKEIKQLPIPWPPKYERVRIATILGALGDKIELNLKMNETLEHMARALFKSWFVDFDPVRAKAEGRTPAGMDEETAGMFPDVFEESELGPIPRGWKVQRLLKIADLLSGGTPKTSVAEYWDGPILWASAKDVSNAEGRYLIGTERTITSRGLAESSTKMIPAGSVAVVARGATCGRWAIIGREMAMNQTCYAVCPHPEWDRLVQHSCAQIFSNLVRQAHGSVFDTITTRTFDHAAFSLPSKEIAARFANLVEPIENNILANLIQTQTLKSAYDSLLPQLLSGNLQVREAERASSGMR